MLYLSLYFKTHRKYYYELLNGVRLTGDWEAWLDFFAEAVIITAAQAVETAQRLLELSGRDKDKINELGRAAASTLHVHRSFMEHPLSTSGWIAEKTHITPATVNKALSHLVRLGYYSIPVFRMEDTEGEPLQYGNCRISFDDVYINREGASNPFAVKRDLRSLYSPRAARVIRVLLSDPKRYWKVEPLAQESAVSIGQIANVKKLLKDREWIQEGEDGFRLVTPLELLTEWAESYSFRKNQVNDFYCMSDLSATEAELATYCSQRKTPFALTGLSGAARVHPGIRFQRTMAYIGTIDKEIINTIGLKTVATGANVSLLLPYDDGVFYKTTDYEGIPVVSPVQLYLDLNSYKGRGEEAAQTILERILKPSWQ